MMEPSYNPEVASAKSRATTALVCGIISLFFLGLVLGVIALVKGLSARNTLKAANEPSGAATAGVIIGTVGLVAWAVLFVILMIYM